jgi:hypothetical protein
MHSQVFSIVFLHSFITVIPSQPLGGRNARLRRSPTELDKLVLALSNYKRLLARTQKNISLPSSHRDMKL